MFASHYSLCPQNSVIVRELPSSYSVIQAVLSERIDKQDVACTCGSVWSFKPGLQTGHNVSCAAILCLHISALKVLLHVNWAANMD